MKTVKVINGLDTVEVVSEKPVLVAEIKAEIKGVAKVEDNINEAKEFALKLKEYYSNLVFTDEQIKEAKGERADINKIKKKIADYRIAILKEFKKPIELFETIAKETEATLTETADFVDKQVKSYEDKQKEIKQQEIDKLLELNTTGVKLSNEKWLNAGYKLSDIQAEIQDFVAKFNQDMELLKDEDIVIRDYYKRTLNIAETLLEKKRLDNLRKQEESEKEEVKNEVLEEKVVETVLQQDVELKNKVTLEFNVTRREALLLKQFLSEHDIEYIKV